jgi:hypothetical protein
VITRYEDCRDCEKNDCPFIDCCDEKDIADRLWRKGWRKVAVDEEEKDVSPAIIKIGCILQSYAERREE